MNIRRWLVVGIVLAGCHSKPDRMPKGFEKLKLGVSTSDALDTVLGDERWREHVALKIDGAVVVKKLGYAKDTKTAVTTLAQGAAELRAQVQGTRNAVLTLVPKITVDSAAPFKSFDLSLENDLVKEIMFFAPYDDGTFDDFMHQAKSKFGEKCEPYEASNACQTKSCEWDFCDEHLAYEVEKAHCSDDSSAVTVSVKQYECPKNEDNSPKL